MSVIDRFKKKEYTNWLKCGQALKCVVEGVAHFCKTVVDELHKQLVNDLGKKQCTAGCDAKKIVRRSGPHGKCWTISCNDNVCNQWVEKIVPIIVTSQFEWRNSTIREWPTQSWQVAKIFMAHGQEPANVDPTKTDVIAMMQLMLNCKEFSRHMDTRTATAVSLTK